MYIHCMVRQLRARSVHFGSLKFGVHYLLIAVQNEREGPGRGGRGEEEEGGRREGVRETERREGGERRVREGRRGGGKRKERREGGRERGREERGE